MRTILLEQRQEKGMHTDQTCWKFIAVVIANPPSAHKPDPRITPFIIIMGDPVMGGDGEWVKILQVCVNLWAIMQG
jgi:hypothetical protein